MIIFILFCVIQLKSQIFIDTVISFKPGSGQNAGQNEQYFPQNIYGPPSYNATYNTPESQPEEVLSIGLNGEIIVAFQNYNIINGDGDDFTIFENAFEYAENGIYAEPAIVSVSQNGIDWFTFPYEIDSLIGLAGVTPTNGKGDLSIPNNCGGNSFDLNELGLDHIKYIKINDITSVILNNSKHLFYDPTLSGFDLDAVVGLNYQQTINSINDSNILNDIKYVNLLGEEFEERPKSGTFIEINKTKCTKYIIY